MEKLNIRHRVKKESEGTYYTIGFDVPENLESITVSYNYRKTAKISRDKIHNVVDIGLIDSDGRFWGWSGSAHKSIIVGEYGSSNGYLYQKIRAGRWSIIVGAYKIDSNGVDVEYEIEFAEKKSRLLFGDLHVHSDASDGQFDIPDLAKMARKRKLDFIGVANHNNYSENFHLPHTAGLTFIPAVEWTHYMGHMNFFGVPNPFENSFIANSKEEMSALIRHAKELGAVISVNHPKCSFCPYLWDDEENFDMIEIWNGPMRPSNIRTTAWWTDLLRQGRKIPIVGGSDYHKRLMPVKLGHPVTGVYAKSPDADDILSALKNGHSFLTRSVDGPKLILNYGEASMGDTAKIEDRLYLEVKASELSGASLIMVTQDEEKPLHSSGGKADIKVEIKKPGFVYLKAIKKIFGFESIRAISNPIYFG